MKYNFQDDVRQMLAHARTEAMRLGHDYIGTEHMLLGMLRTEGCRGAGLLAELGLSLDRVRSDVAARVERGTCEPGAGELPYTSRAKKVLELAMSAARDRRDRYVGTEHLLLGMLKEQRGIAGQVLTLGGVTEEQVQMLLAGKRPPHVAPAVAPRLRIEIDDRSDRSIYEQIVGRVKEAVATGEVSAGERLPPVRRLADQLDIAPGTVARAYTELERLGVVITEGARGTRVADPSPRGEDRSVNMDQVAGLLRPVAVAAFHMGAGPDDLRGALEVAMEGIFEG
jgi:DNA-binding transcriptional regulator YhcF (GntR family)